jgi:hypothetical protein
MVAVGAEGQEAVARYEEAVERRNPKVFAAIRLKPNRSIPAKRPTENKLSDFSWL